MSQLRAEALLLLKDGMNSQLDPDQLAPEPRPNGRVARRKAAYYTAVAAGSTARERIAASGQSIYEKVAAREEQERAVLS